MEVAAKPLLLVVTFAAAKLTNKVLKDDWAVKFQPQLDKIDAGINALRTKELKAAQIHFDLARIRLNHDLNDESARNELESAKKEAVKALGVVSKVKEKVEVIELVLTIEILLFLNAESGDHRRFLSTRDQCFYFLRKLKELPQVAHYFDVELRGAFSKGTFHSERMWLLTEVFRMDVDVGSFFVSYGKEREVESSRDAVDGAGASLAATLHESHASFQNSLEVLYSKTKDESLGHLLTRQLGDMIDLYCLTRDATRWFSAKNLATVLSLDVRNVAEERIQSFASRYVKEFEARRDAALLESIASIRGVTGVAFSSGTLASLCRLLEENARAFFSDGNRDALRVAEIIVEKFDVSLTAASEVIPQLLSYWSNVFLNYDRDGDASRLLCVPSLVTIYGSMDLLNGREDVACVMNESLEGLTSIAASSFRSTYAPRNTFSTDKSVKWMSAELAGQPFHEWICRTFVAPVKVAIVAMKATPHVQAAPTKLSLEGRREEGEAWTTLLMAESLVWKYSKWKTFAVTEPDLFKQYRINFFENASSNVVSVFKIKLFI